MKHILIITTSYPNGDFTAGQEAAGAFVSDFAVTLSKHINVTVIAPSLTEGEEITETLHIKRFIVPSLPLSLLKAGNPSHWSTIAKTLQAGKRAAKDIVEKESIDYIFALWALPSGYWAKCAAAKDNIPYFIWTLGSDIWTLGKIPIIKSILRWVLHGSRKCYADGYMLAAETAKIGGCNCSFLPSARILPDHREKKLKEKPPYNVAFLGRWHPNKGADMLADALQLLEDEDWQLIKEVRYCGGGPLVEYISDRIKFLQREGRPISLEGYLDQQEALELFMWTDYLMIPSRIESIPVIFSDAMQTATPVIATPVGDLPRLLQENQVGVLAETCSAYDYKKAISKSLKTSPLIFEGGMKKVKKQFDIRELTKKFYQERENV